MFSTSSCGFATCFRHAFDFFSLKPSREPAASIWTCRDWCSRFATRFSTKKVESVSKACRKPARTCRKPGCKQGRKPGLQPGLQLARITECGLKWISSLRAWSICRNRFRFCTESGFSFDVQIKQTVSAQPVSVETESQQTFEISHHVGNKLLHFP